jgi:hypothetical protein
MERSQKKAARKPRVAASASRAAAAPKPRRPTKPGAATKPRAKSSAAAPAAKKTALTKRSPRAGKPAPAKAAVKATVAPLKRTSKAKVATARREPAAKKAVQKRPAAAKKIAAPRKRGLATSEAASRPQPEIAPTPGLNEEEQIEAAKYLPREAPPRVFEEERFIFPQSYGVTRVRLLVKDPYWLFAHWDVAPAVWSALRGQLGERAAALSRLTLKVVDAHQGGGPVILLPGGARSWYIRADDVPRSYRAELGLTLPSGQFRRLALSNQVTTPRVGPSNRKAGRRHRWDPARQPGTGVSSTEGDQPGSWTAEGQTVADSGALAWSAATTGAVSPLPERGGASDAFRR